MKQRGSISILALWITLLLALIITLILGSRRMQLDLGQGKKEYLESEMKAISVKNILQSGDQLNGIKESGTLYLDTRIHEFQNLPITIEVQEDKIHCYFTIEEPVKRTFDLTGIMETKAVDEESFQKAEENLKKNFPEGKGDCIYKWDDEIYISTKGEYENFITAIENLEEIEKEPPLENPGEEEPLEEEPLEEERLPEPPGEVLEKVYWYESPWIFGEMELEGFLLGNPKIQGKVNLKGGAILKEKIEDLEVQGVLYTLEGIQGEIPEELEFLKPEGNFKVLSFRSLR